MPDKPPASHFLEKKGIPHEVFTHQSPITSIDQAAAERNQEVSQVVRSILFRLSQDHFALVMVAGKQQISWPALRQHFNQSRLTMASPDEVLAITGYPIGAVSPFGIPEEVPILVDERVLTQPAISLGSGTIGTAILITTPNLLKALGEIQIGKFAQL